MEHLIQKIEQKSITMGCEFTFWPKNSKNWSRRPKRLLTRAFNGKPPKWMIDQISEEDRLIECPSTVQSKYQGLEQQWRDFDRLVRRVDGKYRYYQYDSGGGHIHLSHDYAGDDLIKFKKVLLTLISNHPEVVWAFNGPRDNHNAKIPQLFEYLIPKWRASKAMQKKAIRNEYGILFLKFEDWLDIFNDSYKLNIAACLRTIGTVEYRFPDAPSSLTQLKLNFAVCSAFHLKAMEIVDSGAPIPQLKYGRGEHDKISWEEARQNLISFAQEHGIPTKSLVRQFKNLKCKFFPELYFKGKFKERELLV